MPEQAPDEAEEFTPSIINMSPAEPPEVETAEPDTQSSPERQSSPYERIAQRIDSARATASGKLRTAVGNLASAGGGLEFIHRLSEQGDSYSQLNAAIVYAATVSTAGLTALGLYNAGRAAEEHLNADGLEITVDRMKDA